MSENAQVQTVETAQESPTDSAVSEQNTDTTADVTENATTDTSVNAEDAKTDAESGSTEQLAEGSEAPDAYAEFAVPEGIESLDTELLDRAMPLFKEAGLSQEQAQGFVDLYAEKLRASEQKSLDTFSELVDGWAEASKSDKEYGGDAFEQNVKIANDTLTKFGTPELDQFLKESGAGNHPEVIRLLYKVGKLMQEDVPGAANPANNAPRDRVSVLYPNS